jgi:hypothetical protein
MHIEPDENPYLKTAKGTFKQDLTPEIKGFTSLCIIHQKATNNLF